MPLSFRPCRTAATLPLACLLALTGCSTDNVFAPQKFFPGSDRQSFSDCGKFGVNTGLPQVCGGVSTAPGGGTVYSISFYLPSAAHVRITAYDQNAKLVKLLLDQDEPAGDLTTWRVVDWDFTNDEGERVKPGDYRLYFSAGDFLKPGDVEVP